jgi:predicted metal-dependent phosphoesterase TrpH
VKIDIHVHTKERSPCGRSSELEQVRAAVAAGLDAIVFTDHNQRPPADTLVRLNEDHAPFRIFGGMELTVDDEDLLVLGVRDAFMETERWSYPDLHGFVRERGGVLVLAHPFRFHPDIRLPLETFPPDAIEVSSRNTPREALDRIVALAQELGLVPLSNSDAHAVESLGRHYNVLDRRPRDERELLGMLRAGQVSCVVPGEDGTRQVFRRGGG